MAPIRPLALAPLIAVLPATVAAQLPVSADRIHAAAQQAERQIFAVRDGDWARDAATIIAHVRDLDAYFCEDVGDWSVCSTETEMAGIDGAAPTVEFIGVAVGPDGARCLHRARVARDPAVSLPDGFNMVEYAAGPSIHPDERAVSDAPAHLPRAWMMTQASTLVGLCKGLE